MVDAFNLGSHRNRLRVYHLETNKEVMIATIFEWFNDRKGDLNKDEDVFVRLLLLWFEAFALHFIFGKPVWSCFLLSASVFFFVFDYWIAYTLIKNGTIEPPRGVKYHWFSYTGKSGVVDNVPFWKKMNPWAKFSIRLLTLITAIIIYL